MNSSPARYWQRALEALRVAKHDIELSADATASRAYYAAFYAVSGLLLLSGARFSKQSALEVAVHCDLVKTGQWAPELARRYSKLLELRSEADYDGVDQVSINDAREAIESAEAVIRAVSRTRPDQFVLPDDF